MIADREPALTLEALLAGQRPRLVRLCARLTGHAEAAEDLAQETLLEAWRSLGKLRTPEGLAPWLSAIARNVCLRWARERGREQARRLDFSTAADGPSSLDDLPAQEDELALLLERGELAELLDRALALLPAETRRLLIESYVRELPYAELAARSGATEGALRVRLHRGRLALQRILSTELRDEAAAFGLALPEDTGWHETRIWCPFCGRHRLRSRIDPATGEYAFHCAGTCEVGRVVGSARNAALLEELTSAKSIVTRHCLYLDGEYRRAIVRGAAVCPNCGREWPVQHQRPDHPLPDAAFPYGIAWVCPACDLSDSASAWHLALDTRVAQRFWRQHPRMRALPVREIECDGQPALVTGFESADEAARLELISARDTYEVLRVQGEAQG